MRAVYVFAIDPLFGSRSGTLPVIVIAILVSLDANLYHHLHRLGGKDRRGFRQHSTFAESQKQCQSERRRCDEREARSAAQDPMDLRILSRFPTSFQVTNSFQISN